MTLAQLIVKIGADLTEFRMGLEEVEKSASRLGGHLQSIGMRLSAALTVPLGLIGGAAIKMAADIEQSKIAFSTMLGSAEQADKFLREMFDFAAKTPFEFTQLQDASKKLLAFGFASAQIIPMMTAIGNAASGLGGGAEMVSRITLALGQMQAKGKVSAQEMMQLAEAGIPAWEILAKTIGTSIPEAMKAAEQGIIPAKIAIEGLVEGMNARFPGMMEKQSQTLSGVWSTFKDNVAMILMDLGVEISDALDLKNVIRTLGDWLKKAAEWFRSLSPTVRQVAVVFGAVAAAIGPVLVVVGTLVSSWGALAGVLAVITGPVGIVIAAFGALLVAGVLLYKNWDAVKHYAIQAWGYVKIYILKAIDYILAGYEKFLGWIPKIGEAISAARKNVGALITQEEAQIAANAAAYEAEALKRERDKAAAAAEQSAARISAANKAAFDLAAAKQAEEIKKIMEAYAKELQEIEGKLKLFGDEHAAANEKAKLLEGTIRKLLETGVAPASPQIQDLTTKLAALKEQMAAFEQAQKVSDALGSYAEKVRTSTAGLAVFGDLSAYITSQIDATRNAINQLLAAGLDPMDARIQSLVEQLNGLQGMLGQSAAQMGALKAATDQANLGLEVMRLKVELGQATEAELAAAEKAARDARMNQEIADTKRTAEEIALIKERSRLQDVKAEKNADLSKMQLAQGYVNAASQIGNAMMTISGTQNKKAFAQAKAFNIAQAIMSTYAGAAKAYGQTGIYGAVAAAGIIAAGMAQVAQIKAQQPPAMAAGGVVTRPTMALVGERGPEAVIPLDKLGGGSSSEDSRPIQIINVLDPRLFQPDRDAVVNIINQDILTNGVTRQTIKRTAAA